MNKVILMGRLTRDPETRYTQSANPMAITKYGLAVRRSYARQGEPDVDFFNITAFGKAGEFADKYFKKGQMVAVVGKVQISSWEDQLKVKHTSVDVIVDEQYFAESKGSYEDREQATPQVTPQSQAMPQPSSQYTEKSGGDYRSGFRGGLSYAQSDEDDLPF